MTIPESRLVELRSEGQAAERAGCGFVDPSQLRRCGEIIDRRGERWVTGVLGRDISRRSATFHHRPYLVGGEYRVIVTADAEKDRATLAELDPDLEAR